MPGAFQLRVERQHCALPEGFVQVSRHLPRPSEPERSDRSRARCVVLRLVAHSFERIQLHHCMSSAPTLNDPFSARFLAPVPGWYWVMLETEESCQVKSSFGGNRPESGDVKCQAAVFASLFGLGPRDGQSAWPSGKLFSDINIYFRNNSLMCLPTIDF